MTLPIVLAIAGSIAILLGLFGGGIKAKEIEVPKISAFPRILLILVGLSLVWASIGLPFPGSQLSAELSMPTASPSLESVGVQPIVDSVLPTSTPTVYPTDTPVPSLTPTNTSIPPTATSTELLSPCEMLDGKSISATQIGYNSRRYQVVYGPYGIQLVDKGSGNYSFSTLMVIEGDPTIDSVIGTCKGDTLALTRTRPSANNFIQESKGELSLVNGVVTIEGTFNHNTSNETYRWFGSIVEPSP